MDELIAEFKQVYKDNGADDLHSQVRYLAALADDYYQRGADNSDWVCLLKAHTLYNSVARRDKENEWKWSEKAFNAQRTYWGDQVKLSYDRHREITHKIEKRLAEIRAKTWGNLELSQSICSRFSYGSYQIITSEDEELYEQFVKEMENTTQACTADMVRLFNLIVQESIEIMGDPPCGLSVVGMGSLAREEATPYSDLEFMFLVEHKSIETTEYFERLAMTVYFLIGNLKETKLRYMAIEELTDWFDDKAVNGLKIDGLQPWAGNIPTGNGTEEQHNHLLSTVEELVSRYKVIYEEPHPKKSLCGDLTAMLSITILLYQYGDVDLHSTFKTALKEMRQNEKRRQASRNMLMNDVKKDKFYFIPHITQKNLKLEIYRFPSLLMLNLRICHRIDLKFTEAITHLVEQKVLSQSSAKALRLTFYCALYMRLSAYLFHCSQNDSISILSANPDISGAPNLWYVGRSLLLHMTCHLMPLREAVENGRLSRDFAIAGHHSTLSMAFIEMMCGNYQLAYSHLDNIHVCIDDFVGKVMLLRGFCAFILARYDEGKEMLLKFVGSEDPKLCPANVKCLPYLLLSGISYQEGQLDNAKRYFTAAVELAPKSFNAKSGAIGDTFADDAGMTVRSKEFFPLSLVAALAPHVPPPQAPPPHAPARHVHDHHFSSELLQILSLYFMQKFQQAELKALELADAIHKECGHSDNPILLYVYFYLGAACLAQRKTSEAFTYFNRFLAMNKRLHQREDTIDVFHCYQLQADTYRQQGKYTDATECLSRSLEIWQRIVGDVDHFQTARLYFNLGFIQNQHGNAEEWYTKSLEMYQRLCDSDHAEIALCYFNLGAVGTNQKEYTKAVKWYIKSLEIRQRLHNLDHPEIVRCYFALGHSELNRQRYWLAENYFTTALDMLQRHRTCSLHRPDYLLILFCHLQLQVICLSSGKYIKAVQWCIKSLDFYPTFLSFCICFHISFTSVFFLLHTYIIEKEG